MTGGLSDISAGPGYSSRVPARLDRLPWNRFHTKVVIGLGVSWILDGLEVQIAAQISVVFADPRVFALSDSELGLVASVYLFGQVIGALVFGRLTVRLGRRRLFFATLGLYLVASGLAAFSPDLWFLLMCQLLAGAAIGGEYTAINSAIDELIPAYSRGRVDIMVNGTYWAGALIGSAANLVLLDPRLFGVDVGWRVSMLLGAVIGLIVIGLRTTIKESPRWLMTQGRHGEAEAIVDKVEADLLAKNVTLVEVPKERALQVTGRHDTSYGTIARTMLETYRSRSVLGFAMMIAQAVLFNAVFFPFAQVLARFFGETQHSISLLFLPFAAANLLGPLLLAPLFDTVGRRRMITFTYGVSGVLLAIATHALRTGLFTAVTLTAAFCVIFFFASAGASSAYLTISEIFPLEMRAQAISFFFAVSQLIGGVATPRIFSGLINHGDDPGPLSTGYLVVAVILVLCACLAWWLGVDAERKSLERVARPLSTAYHETEPPLRHD
jgi:MFS family permease